jgi:nucleoside-triphosphatase
MPDEVLEEVEEEEEEIKASDIPKIGITGLPHAGKTQTLLKIIEMLEAEEFVVGGMITESIVFRNKRVGFYVMDWLSKKKRKFAHVNIESSVYVGKYGVDMKVLDSIGVHAISSAVEKADVIIIDEVGKMEVESQMFVKAVKDALDSDKPLIITLHKKSRNPLLQDIRRRDDIRILEVTPVNRNLLPYKIMKLMRGELV